MVTALLSPTACGPAGGDGVADRTSAPGAPEASGDSRARPVPGDADPIEYTRFVLREYGVAVRVPQDFRSEPIVGMESGRRFVAPEGDATVEIAGRREELDPDLDEILREVRSGLARVARQDTLPTGASIIGEADDGAVVRRQLFRIAPGVLVRLSVEYRDDGSRRFEPIADTLFGSLSFAGSTGPTGGEG